MKSFAVTLCLCIAGLCQALSVDDKRFVDLELQEMRNAPRQAYVRVLRIASKGEEAIAIALPAFLDSFAAILESGDTYFVLDLLSAVGRFETQSITKEQFALLEKLAKDGDGNVKSSLQRAKEKVKPDDVKKAE